MTICEKLTSCIPTVNSIMKDKTTASSFDELNLNESLILAQDERWRRA